MPHKPVLVFGYGNPGRGDDAVGPLLIEYIQQHFDTTGIDLLTDFQLQIEHALDLENRELVLFADASTACAPPFELAELQPVAAVGYTTHAMHPSAVMAVYRSIRKTSPPPCFLLAIKGETFELGEGLSNGAERNLRQAALFVEGLLENADLVSWQSKAHTRPLHEMSANHA